LGEKSENSKKHLGISYYCFASSEGEVFSGGGSLPRDAFIDDITDCLNSSLKGLTDENPHRTVVLTVETEPDNQKEWVTYEYSDTRRNHVLAKLASFFYSIGFWITRFTDEKRRVVIIDRKDDS